MRHAIKIILAVLLMIMSSILFAEDSSSNPSANLSKIANYQHIFVPCFDNNGNLQIAIRFYEKKKTPYYLVVNPYTFETSTAPVSSFRSRRTLDLNVPGYFSLAEIQNTPYVKALYRYTATPSREQNAGIVHSENQNVGYFLTIDMCPSVKPFEQGFFSALIQKSTDEQRAIPIALSMTGLWLLGHPDEFNWFIEQEKTNKLKITWINHTYSHIYYNDQGLPLNKNFLLSMLVNIDSEILLTEQLLLERGQLPSVFIRFPGLISNDDLIKKVQEYGLIPVGSDAWLAKGEEQTDGSIILIHGNSNEHKGIEIAMPLVVQPNFHLLPLSDAFNKSK